MITIIPDGVEISKTNAIMIDIQPFTDLISHEFAPKDEFGKKKIPSESLKNNIFMSLLEIPSNKFSEYG